MRVGLGVCVCVHVPSDSSPDPLPTCTHLWTFWLFLWEAVWEIQKGVKMWLLKCVCVQ